MKNGFKYFGIPILILIVNYVAVSSLMSYFTSSIFQKKGVNISVIVIVIFFSGWIIHGKLTKYLWKTAIVGALVFFIAEGILKGIYYYIVLTLKPVDTLYPEGYKRVVSLAQLYWGLLYAPIAAIISLFGGFLRNLLLKGQRIRNTTT